MNVYRPSRVFCVIITLASMPFALFGSAGLAVGTAIGMASDDWCGYLFFLFFAIIGSSFMLIGLVYLGCRVETNQQGLNRVSFFGFVVIHDPWESLTSWTVGKLKDDELADPRFVEFIFERRPGPIRIDAYMIGLHSGFDKFLEDLRSRVGLKEIPELPDIRKRS